MKVHFSSKNLKHRVLPKKIHEMLIVSCFLYWIREHKNTKKRQWYHSFIYEDCMQMNSYFSLRPRMRISLKIKNSLGRLNISDPKLKNPLKERDKERRIQKLIKDKNEKIEAKNLKKWPKARIQVWKSVAKEVPRREQSTPFPERNGMTSEHLFLFHRSLSERLSSPSPQETVRIYWILRNNK